METEAYSTLSRTGSSVFLMIRFREDAHHERIEATIRSTLAGYGLELLRADAAIHDPQLFTNIEHYMDRCDYGIAVIDWGNDEPPSVNATLELGYMLGLKKRCLLLKEKQAALPVDLAGYIRYEFDAADIEGTVGPSVLDWLRQLGVAKRPEERLLIYVSQGGTCRDPMAKAITLKLLEGRPLEYPLRVEAAAVGHPSLDAASAGARQAIQEMYGEDLLADHRPVVLSPALRDEADLLLAMDHSLMKTLPRKGKAHVLRHFLGSTGDIVDPWFPGDEAAYRACAAELRELLESGIDKLVACLAPASARGASSSHES